MKNNISVSVGIPAHNEGANIKHLLSSVLSQKERGFILKEILVISDGSTDDTALFARSIKDKRIKVIDDKNRLGKSARLQSIFEKFRGDVLFLMDADIAITDKLLLSKVLLKTDLQRTGIVSVNATPLPADTVFEEIIEVGVNVMKDIRRNWRDGNNYLPFKGCFLGMHKDLAKATFIPAEVVSNDSYLYFNAISKGYKPEYLEDIAVYYRSPRSFADHNKQSSRALASREEMAKYFELNWDHEFSIPRATFVRSIIKALKKQPVLLAAYISISLFGRVKKQSNITSMWTIAYSTKEVINYG
jgi:glycosyltransferase involved in cell wall biosynthesis